jgi:predicted CXXCH cytochrome family protein
MTLVFFCIFYASCDEADRHEALTFFFDGVPPLRPEMLEEGPVDANAIESAQEGQKPTWYVHEPRKDCSICHGKRKQRSFSSQTYLTMPVPKLCYDCHTDYTLSESYVHGPVAVGQCLFCHNPHKSKIEHLLIAPEPGLCYQCHDIDTIELIAAHLNKQLSACTDCHYAHAGSVKALLKEVSSEINNGLSQAKVAEATSQSHIKTSKDPGYQAYSEQQEKASEALPESKNLSEVFRETSRLIEQGKLKEAGVYLEKLKDNAVFTAEEREQIARILAMINKVISRRGQQPEKVKKEQKKPGNEQESKQPAGNSVGSSTKSDQKAKKIAELYYSSMAFYRTGQLLKAREGFINILKSGLIPESMAKTIRGYISDIDSSLARNETSKKSKR